MVKRLAILFALVLFSLLVLAGCGQKEQTGAAKEDAASFYKGKTITFIVPFNPGGGYDTYARLVAPILEKETGATVVVENVPGGGGLKGYNQVYNSQPDGLTVGIFNLIGAIPAQLMGDEGVKFDLNKFTWIGRLADDPQVLVVSPKSNYQKFEDLLNAKQIKFAATSTTGSTYIDPMAIIHAFGLTEAKIATGYEGTNGSDMAVIRGEADATVASLSSKMAPIKNGDLKPLALIYPERIKDLGDVPTVSEMQLDDKGKKLLEAVNEMAAISRSVAGPPAIPEDRAKFLRDAMLKALQDAELQSNAAKASSPIVPLSGEELTQKVAKAMQLPAEFVQALKAGNSSK